MLADSNADSVFDSLKDGDKAACPKSLISAQERTKSSTGVQSPRKSCSSSEFLPDIFGRRGKLHYRERASSMVHGAASSLGSVRRVAHPSPAFADTLLDHDRQHGRQQVHQNRC